MPDFTLVTDGSADYWKAKLTELGLDSHGACHDCGGPVGSRLTVTLDEEDRVHAVAEAACPACEGGS